MRKRIAAFLIALTLPLAAFAQTASGAATAPAAVLVYADNPDAVEIIDSDGFSRVAFIGDEVKPGETIKTQASGAELKLEPNGSLIKIAKSTSFKVEGLAGGPSGGDSNNFALLGGKIRTVAARASGQNKYKIRTQTAVCGVRGTDFSMIVNQGKQDAVFVKKGLVEFARTAAGGAAEAVMVGAGQFADALGATFAPAAFSESQFAESFGNETEFVASDPNSVDQGEPVAAPAEEKPEEEPAAEEPPAEETPAEEPVQATTPAVPQESTSSTQTAAKAATPKVDTSQSKIIAWLQDMLGFEIGSVVIDGTTYSKAVIQPTFSLGKLRMGLYLPIIYTSDLFNPEDWYHPAGNDEWSFGMGDWESDPLKAAMDAASDLALKIRFIELGTPLVDPFYLKVGNLNSMTIGHGVIMRNFANDTDFPAVRRVGLNMGMDFGALGYEAVVNDLANPEIFGGRVYVRPIPKFKLAWGLSAIADIDPAADLSDSQQEALGDPMLFGLGTDLDLPIISSGLLSIRAFADAAAVMPWTTSAITDGSGTTVLLKAGPQIDTVYDTSQGFSVDALRNYGLVGGFLGNVLFIDWRLEYRYYKGAFRPTFFDSTYERNRGTYITEFIDLAKDPSSSANETTVNGVYGEANFNMLKDRLVFNAGYMMPWSTTPGVEFKDILEGDYLQASLNIEKGVIPIIDIAGAITYERTGFASGLFYDSSNFSFFDANTVLKGEITYPVADSLDLAIIVSTATKRDSNGNVVYKSDNTTPEIEPTVSFETRIQF